MKTVATSRCPAHWRMAQVAQNMPETDESATDFVVAGDTRLGELQAQLARAEADDDGMAIAHAYTDLHDAGSHDAVPRAQALILGLGFQGVGAGQRRSTASPAAGACACNWRAR
jgi:ATPase subunit of ABC transporter with duplicated ATPase domains